MPAFKPAIYCPGIDGLITDRLPVLGPGQPDAALRPQLASLTVEQIFDGKQIADHLRSAFAALPECVQTIRARADSGFYCWEAIEAYLKQANCWFIVVARKTSRLTQFGTA